MVQQALVFYDNNTVSDLYSQLFVNELFGSIRSILINNEPWFIGKEVCDILGYVNSRDALRVHVYDECKSAVAIHDGSQRRNVAIINEAGLYQLIFSSKMPNARQFQLWVYSEVLPTMRQIGFTNSMSILREELDILHNRLDNTECDKQYYKRQYNVLNGEHNRLEKDYNTLEDKYNKICKDYNELDNNYDTLVDQFQYVIDNNDIKYY